MLGAMTIELHLKAAPSVLMMAIEHHLKTTHHLSLSGMGGGEREGFKTNWSKHFARTIVAGVFPQPVCVEEKCVLCKNEANQTAKRPHEPGEMRCDGRRD